MPVPGLRFGRLTDRAHTGSAEKVRIEGCPHPYRRLPVAGIGAPLVKEPCRSKVTSAKEGVAAIEELRDLPCGEARGSLGRRRED